ncbi:MAG: hypothetical protein H7A46_17665 [Verrucomicrobiales bacterium]|nr:hypothetical protein [Verrucomicrobiales bacterium]
MQLPISTSRIKRPAAAGGWWCGGRSRRRGTAFSLMELVAVMAILTLLSVVVVPVLIQVFDRMARTAEEERMTRLIEGLKGHVLRNRNIPFTNNLAAAIGTEIGLDPDAVLTNARGLRRVCLLDPAITNSLPIPFTQDWRGVTNNMPRLMGVLLVSSISRDLPATLVSGFTASSAAFSNIWYAADGALPTGWTWEGEPDDLILKRLNLRDLFVDVTLNYDTWTVSFTNLGRFTVDNSATNTLPGFSTVYSTRYLAGTVLGLHSHDGLTDTLESSEILRDPCSYVYEIDTWRGRLFTGRGVKLLGGLDLQSAHDLFLAAPWNANAKGNPAADQQMVVDDMTAYMEAYLEWAEGGFQSKFGLVNEAKVKLDTDATYLIFKPNNEN